IALSVAKTEEIFKREHELAGRGGFVLEPNPDDAVPANLCGHGGTFVSRCLRTIPTRENAGNIDVKQLTKGGRLLIPVFVPGTLLARNAALNMIDHLVRTRELTRQQAYMLSSTAVDLHINQLVDVPNFLVSAFLHLDVFQDDVGDEEGK